MSHAPHPRQPHVWRRRTLRQMAWRAMQVKQKFTLTDLVRHAVPEGSDARDPRNNIGRYVKVLTNVGVLIEMKQRAAPTKPKSEGQKRWMLVRDLGREAPVIRSARQVYDPNSRLMINAPVMEGEGGHVE